MIKVGYLICAHQYPHQLLRLVNALDHPGISFFIHVDERSNFNEFHEVLKTRRNVYFSKQRYSIERKGWSHVLAWLELMRISSSAACRYYSLLSGSDYPIKSPEEIYQFFSTTNQEYLSYFKVQDRPNWLFKIQQFHYGDLKAEINRAENVFDQYLLRLELKARRTFHAFTESQERILPAIPVYGGSEWCSLSQECIDYILRFIDQNPSLSQFFKYTDSPIEMFFQTVVLNSPLRSRVIGIEDYSKQEYWGEKRHPWATSALDLRYIIWKSERFTNHGSGNLRGPAVLDDRDIPGIQSSPALFARKFDPTLSAGLLNWIDKMLIGRNCAV